MNTDEQEGAQVCHYVLPPFYKGRQLLCMPWASQEDKTLKIDATFVELNLLLAKNNFQGCHLSATSKFPDFSLIFFTDNLQFSIPSDR